MRKDYRPARAATGAEADAAEFWTAIWEGESIEGDRERVERLVESSDEYRVVAPYLMAQPADRRRALDGGCGLGTWVAYLAARGFDAIGVDFSEPTVARLHEALPGLAWRNGNITALDLPDGSVDVYLSWGTFEHFEAGLAPPLREARRVLADGGMLLFSVPCENLRVRLQRVETPPAAEALTFYQWRLSSDELRLECARHGLAVQRLAPIHTREGARRLVRSLAGGRLRGRSAELLARVLERVLPAAWLGHMVLVVARKPG